MPPKKGKKGKKFDIDDDDGEDIKLGDIPEPTAAAAKPKAPAPKKKKAKQRPVAGDWSDDEDAEIQEPSVVEKDEAQEDPSAVPRAPASASTFALLQDGADEKLEEEEDDEGRNDSTGSDAGADGKADEHFGGESASTKGIVCAEVTRISKHPNADRLRICQLNAGSKSLQVVTNAPNIKEGMRTALALEGAQTPGSNIAVAAATVRGSNSFGMICSAYDLGWMDAANGLAVRLPQDMKLGAPLDSTAPEGANLGAEGDEEPAASQASKKSSKKKKGKDSRSAGVANAFEALGLEDEGSPADAEEDSAAVSKQEESAAGTADAAEQEEVAAVKPKGRKKKSKVDIGSAFAALGLEDDADSNAANMNCDSHGSNTAYSKANGHAAAAEENTAVDHAEPEPESVKLNGKKRQKKRSSTDVDALLASMGETPASPEQEVDGESPDDTAASKQKETKKKKKKDRKHGGDVDLLLAQLNDIAAPQEPAAASMAAAETQQEAEQDPPAASKSKDPNKDKKASKGADEDINALLAEIGGDSSGSKARQPSSEAAPAEKEAEASAPASEPPADEAAGAKAQSKKNKKNKKGKQDKQEVEDDLDAILAELDGKPPPAQQSDATGTAAGAAPAEEAITTEPADASEATGELSAAAKKKLKKKAKEKAKKDGGPAEEPAEVDEEAPAAASVTKKGGKKVSAAVRRMQEALERQEREAAEAAQREAERRAAEEEAARKAAEEEERLAAEREQRKAERAARRAEAKRQGLLLTGKAKKEAERLAMLREQLLRNSGVDVAGASPREHGDKPVPKKVVYGKKKPAKKEPASGDAADKTAEEEQAALAERQAAEEATKREQEEEARKAAEEAERARQEEAAAQAAAVEPEESEDDMNWENMDLDTVKLPGTKKEEPPAPEPAKRPAKEDEAAVAPAAAKKQKQAPEAKAAEKVEDEEEEEEEEDEEDEDEESEEGSDDESEEESSEEESSDEDSSSYESSSLDSEEEREERLARQKEMREARLKAAMESGSRDHLRSPICCILGHVDTGKTKLLDNVRRTSVQEGEAGGITQQIGATYVPGEAIAARTESLRKGKEFEMKMPGLLIIDTPGHESFTNLRSRGSGLCDIAILVVDLMHGLEPQTVESIGLLKMRKTPFIIALNKVDRLYAWKSTKDAPMQESLDKQSKHTMSEFQERMKKSMLDLNEQGLNVALYWENPDIRKYVNIVPTSAITGEGIPDLLQLLVKLTQAMMAQRLMFISELQCTVLEVKVIEGLGTTIDVVLVNGVLHEGDQIVVCGLNGAIATSIRSLLTPHPLKELRVKGSYLHHKEITAAQGVKIAAPGLENAVAGTQLLVVGKDDDVSLLKEEVMQDMESIFDSVDRSGEGVCVQASTLGSLEALLEFLRSQESVPVSSIAIGPIHRKDVMRAKVMLEKGCKKFGIILAFDVPVTREAQELADKEGVRIMRADIIYHLFDQFTAYCKEVKEHEQEAAKLDAVFPCILKILPTCVFNKKDPIVVGADIVEGIAKIGTPLCIPSQGGMDLGRIASMEINHVAVDKAKRGDTVALKVEATNTTESSRLYGRHFDHKDDLVSRISRKSIDLLKQHFKDELSKDDWRLVLKLKKVFNID